jgi:hypothetical protein
VSWSIFNNFVAFMHKQFTALDEYPLMQGDILAQTEGLQNFKNVFIHLLIGTVHAISTSRAK